jgi:dTDP-4-dehydrorhamnose reductase
MDKPEGATSADKITVLGSGGMLGYAVSEFYSRKKYYINSVGRKDFDAVKDSPDKLSHYIKDSSLVINCIGIIKQIIEGVNDIDVLKINAVFPKNLAKLCKTLNVPLIHITTDCVYSGLKGDYSEDDFFDADDLYGISKNAGENHECMTLRTSLIGPEKGKQRSLLEWAFSQKGNSVKGFTNHIWNGVTTLSFAEITEKILKNGLYKEGIYHLHSPNKASKYELLSIFNDVFSLNLKIEPYETPVKCDRSMTSKYELSKILGVKTIRRQFQELKDFFSL